ncbi:MAG: Flp family type IVb pilin [Desulfoarculaceae bacterium]|nr:Flp family type IVb pilin [Desulfoarculaceae bacterium]
MKVSTTEQRGFLPAESGVTSIEYALLGSLIAVVIVGTVILIGPILNAIFEKVVAGFSQ